MSKCKPDCCTGSSGDGSGAAVIGFIVMVVVAVYGIFRAIMLAVETIVRIVIEIVMITAITAGIMAAVVLLIFIAVRISRSRRQAQRAGLRVLAIKLADSSSTTVLSPAPPVVDVAQLFAEAATSPDVDPHYVEQILRNAMEGPHQ